MAEEKKHHILIVEDDLGTQQQFKIAIEKAGYLAYVASNYQDAIDIIRTEIIDAAVIDVRLDGEDEKNADGLRILAQISKLESKPQAILATGLWGKYPGLEEYAYAIWEKGQELSTLVSKVKEALEEKEKISPDRIRQSLHMIIAEMARKQLGLLDVCKLILDEMATLINTEEANLFLVQDNVLVVKATTIGETGKKLDVEDSVSGLAVRHQNTVYIPDINSDPRARRLYKQGLGENTKSELAIPLKIGVEPIGVLNFESSKKNAFDDMEIKLIEELASQVAIAINSARLQDQTNTVKRLSEISSEINSIVQKGELEVANSALDKMLDFMRCQKAAIFNYDTVLSKMDFLAFTGLSPEYVESDLSLDSPRTLVIKTQHPIIVSNIDMDKRFIPIRKLAQKEGFKALLELPLVVRDKMIGSIAAYYEDVRYFEAEELALGRLFADHVAIAINNAQQYQLLQELREREKKEAEERLAAEIVHRMKNSVGAIRIWVMTANRECSSIIMQNPDLTEAFQHISKNAEESLELVRELKNKQGILQSQKVDLSEHLRIAINTMKIDSRLYTVQSDITTEQTLVLADNHLYRVFINLIENAIDAMPNGGVISLGVKKNDNALEVWVKDTGRGIPQKQLDQIFRFWYTDKEAEGRGTGLWWVKKYIEAFGGNIMAESKGPNQGAKLTIKFPTASDHNKKTILESILENQK